MRKMRNVMNALRRYLLSYGFGNACGLASIVAVKCGHVELFFDSFHKYCLWICYITLAIRMRVMYIHGVENKMFYFILRHSV